ncbi:MAG: sulfatase-like hydrolase/transferase, partial [Planctomycetes bacterium]|nr:sulfatase-like hydrolase/transferase [Planctomycetota bacterium]
MRAVLSLLVLLILQAADRPSAAAEPRPNLVVLVADDLGWADVGYHGSSIKTPNLDRLAGEGVRLHQHYVASMCSATRSALLSGRYWSRFGVTGATNSRVYPFDTVTLASALQSVGYETAITGKWHLGSKLEWGPRKFGFDHSYGSLAGGVGPWNHRYKRGPYSVTWSRNDELIEAEGHVTDLIAREAVSWLESRGDKPFFLYVPFTAPHIPIDEPSAWLKQYPDIDDLGKRQYAAA